MPISPGSRLGTYQISGPLGAGGMGEVYRARDMRLGREVAVNAFVQRSAGTLAATLGRFGEAESHLREAIAKDPLNSGGYNALGLLYRAMDRWTDAEAVVRKSIELSPQRIGTHHVLGIMLSEQGRHAEAMTETLREPAEWARLTGLAVVQYKAGRKKESDEALAKLITTHGADSAFQIGAVYAMRGETDAAFEWAERAIAQRDAGAAQMSFEPTFRSLHGDPRWTALMKKLGFAS
jgi:Flp pilus assembly protein TadD